MFVRCILMADVFFQLLLGPPGYPGAKGEKGDRGDSVSIIIAVIKSRTSINRACMLHSICN